MVGRSRPASRASRPGRLARRENLHGWLFAAPWILGFVIFTAGPMLASIYLSLTDYTVLTLPKWVGLANYQKLLTADALVGQALKVTTIYAFVSIPLNISLGLAVATLLNSNIRGLRYYRTLYYLPVVLPVVAVTLVWRWIFSGDFGLANWFLSLVGIQGPGWLTDTSWALPALIIMSMWNVGGGIVIYLAGLQGIPTDLFEAVSVDGANWLARFRHVTIPMMTPVIFFELIMGIIGAMQAFTQAYIMTNGGPQDATLFYMLYLYQNAFQFYKMGYASALAWVLLLYILALTLLVFRSSLAWVYYEGQVRKR